jgi:hypothetical protein
MPTAAQQLSFFETFGYLKVSGALRGEMAWINKAFDSCWRVLEAVPDPHRRTAALPFIELVPEFAALLDLPQVQDILELTLGSDWNYLGSDGNIFSGDTPWHQDTSRDRHVRCVKIPIYLDTLRHDSGALRVIPGSHQWTMDQQVLEICASEKTWGLHGRELPAVAIESDPSDVIVFDARLIHGSFGGDRVRRMFSLVAMKACRTPEEIADVDWLLEAWSKIPSHQLTPSMLTRLRDHVSPITRPHLTMAIERLMLKPAIWQNVRA